MTLQEIKDAVESGKTVFWASRSYKVVRDELHDGTVQWLIVCTVNNSAIGLTWQDGVTMNGEPEQFFVE